MSCEIVALEDIPGPFLDDTIKVCFEGSRMFAFLDEFNSIRFYDDIKGRPTSFSCREAQISAAIVCIALSPSHQYAVLA